MKVFKWDCTNISYMVSHPVRSLLGGSKSDERNQTLILALALFVSSVALFATVPQFEAPFASALHELLHSINHILWWEVYAVALITGIALVTVRQRSLLEAWILAFAGGAGVGVNLGGIGLTGGVPSLLFRVLWAIGIGLATALIIGTIGYVLGIGLLRVSSTDR